MCVCVYNNVLDYDLKCYKGVIAQVVMANVYNVACMYVCSNTCGSEADFVAIFILVIHVLLLLLLLGHK